MSGSAERTRLVLATLVAAASGAVYFAVMPSMLVDDAAGLVGICGDLRSGRAGGGFADRLQVAGGQRRVRILAQDDAGRLGVLMPVVGIWLLSGVMAGQIYALAGVFGGALRFGFALLSYAMGEMARINSW